MPTTVGALDNVPGPGDPITSPWAIEASGYVVHPFASKAALDAGWPTAPNGSMAHVLDTGWDYQRKNGVWQPANSTLVWAGSAVIPNIATSGTGLRDVYTYGPGVTYPYPVVVAATSMLYAGYGGGPCTFYADLYLMVNGSVVPAPSGGVQSPGGVYAASPLTAAWPVGAGGDNGFKARINITVSGGTTHTGGSVEMRIFAQ